MTHDCHPRFNTNHILNYADDTTVVGLIQSNYELAYREEVKHIVHWCRVNNLVLNVDQIKEIIVDFRRFRPSHTPLLINATAVEIVSSTKFLGVHITDNLSWSIHTSSLVKKVKQHLHFLQRMSRASLPPPILLTFYRRTIESLLTSCISVWCGNCRAVDRKFLQRVVKTAEKIIRNPLSPIKDIADSRCFSRAHQILPDPTHPNHGLFSRLASGRNSCSIRCRTARYTNSYFFLAIRLLNAK